MILNYKANKYMYNVNEELRSHLHGDLNYKNDFTGNQEFRAGMGFKYYF